MSTPLTIRVAGLADVESLLPLMRGYYRDDALEFVEERARSVLGKLLLEPQWGCVIVAESNRRACGYAILCLGFSLELGGNDAFVDELYVDPDFRSQGVAHLLLDALETEARRYRVVALHLEVDRNNETAFRLYASRDFKRRDRYFLLTKPLSA